MNRTVFLILVIVIVALILLAMWLAWRARTRRDAGVQGAENAPSGPIVAEFTSVMYVSTTPVGEPLSRVAAPGLRYRGRAELQLREDGVTVQVRGESPVHIAVAQLRGGGYASRRAGKAVERDGLALMTWTSGGRELESSFRFDDSATQQQFVHAIDRISGAGPMNDQPNDHQEGNR